MTKGFEHKLYCNDFNVQLKTVNEYTSEETAHTARFLREGPYSLSCPQSLTIISVLVLPDGLLPNASITFTTFMPLLT
jgi:hypothetical protein